jgi:hypothetical protein
MSLTKPDFRRCCLAVIDRQNDFVLSSGFAPILGTLEVTPVAHGYDAQQGMHFTSNDLKGLCIRYLFFMLFAYSQHGRILVKTAGV